MKHSHLLASLTAALLLSAAGAHAENSLSRGAILGPREGDYLLKADDVTYDVNNKLVTATGHVEIDHNERIVTAEKITYDQNSDTVVATGHVVMLTPDGNVVFGTQVTLTDAMRDGVLESFRALIGKTGKIAAVEATRKNGTVTTMQRAAFTTCKVCNQPGQRTPLWQVKAYHVIWDETTHKIIYHDAIIEAFGIPVAYTPYFSQTDPTVKRSSGILTPDVGTSNTLGTYIKLPVYISFNDSQDMTVEAIVSTEGGEVLEGEYRQRWNNGGMWLQGTVANNPEGGLSGHEDQTYSSLFGSGRVALNSDNSWHFGFDAQLTSNPTYLERYKLYNKDDQLFNDLFFEGVSGRSRFAITGYFFQSLVGACPVTNPPTLCTPATISPLFIHTAQIPLALPLIEYSYIPEHSIAGGNFRLDLNTIALTRDEGPDDERMTAEARWELPLVTQNGQLVTIRADARGDLYHTTNNDPIDFPDVPTKSNYIARGIPYIGLDWRWPFITGGGAGNTAYIVEPIVQAIAQPYGGNPKGIPNEGSVDIELGDNDVFSFDRMPGYDIVESGPRANVGFRTEALFPKGSLEIQLGEVLRLKPDPVFTEDTGFGGKTSDVVGRFTIKFPPYFSLTHRIDVDQSTGTVRRNQVYLDGHYGRSSIEVSYVRLPEEEVIASNEPREEVNGQATLGITDHWMIFAAGRRDLANSAMLDDEFGVGYSDECLGLSISYRRQYTRDRDVPPSTDILFSFKLYTEDQTDVERINQLFPRHLFSSTTL